MRTEYFVKCPMDGTENQKFCGLVDHFKETATTHTCPHRQECEEYKTHIINKENIIRSIFQGYTYTKV